MHNCHCLLIIQDCCYLYTKLLPLFPTTTKVFKLVLFNFHDLNSSYNVGKAKCLNADILCIQETCFSVVHKSYSRIDMCLADLSVLHQLTHVEIKSITWSGHAPISVTFKEDLNVPLSLFGTITITCLCNTTQNNII